LGRLEEFILLPNGTRCGGGRVEQAFEQLVLYTLEGCGTMEEIRGWEDELSVCRRCFWKELREIVVVF
ncbi:MAG: hypothetical protein WBM35_07840, partial [Candidatus Electrothrix sp.]